MRTNVSRAGWPLARVVAGACAVLLSAACTAWPESGGDLLSAPAVIETPRYAPPVPEDLSGLSWIEAFDALVAKMSREYALARWKDIHWPGMIDSYRPRIVAAQAAGDIGAYYLALREYVHAFHDGHVALRAFGEAPQTIIDAVERKLAGGGFGLTITKLEDGRVIATWVKPGGPAAQAGMEPGAEILSWGGKPVDAALDQTMTVLGPSQATIGRRAREQLRYLVRAPVGVSIDVSFRNGSRGDRLRPGRSLTERALDLRRTVLLTSVDDDLETLIRTDARSVLRNGWPERMVEHAILPGNVGYVRIYVELDLPAEAEGDHTPTLELFRTAIAEFVDAKVAGIIVDLRGNAGGSDKMVTDLMALFYDRKTFYEYQNLVVPSTGEFQIWIGDDVGNFSCPGEGLWIEPAAPQYKGPVVALVDNGCISSGEGLAMAIKNLPSGRVVGFEGTNGSFGIAGDMALMPEDFEIDWPYGQSLDERGVVQIDSRGGEGGVLPDYLVPMTFENALRLGAGDDVALEYGLQVLRTAIPVTAVTSIRRASDLASVEGGGE